MIAKFVPDIYKLINEWPGAVDKLPDGCNKPKIVRVRKRKLRGKK